LAVQVWLRCDNPDAADFVHITGRFQTMYESLWREDARFNYFDHHPLNNMPFFLVSNSPTHHGPSTLVARLMREPGLNGFTVDIDRYPNPERRDDTESLFAGHFALDVATWPPVNDNGEGNTARGDGGSSRDMSPEDQTHHDNQD
jgi:hypothetical protein